MSHDTKRGEGGFTGPQHLEENFWERGGAFFREGGGCNFHTKNKLKFEIFNDKNSL